MMAWWGVVNTLMVVIICADQTRAWDNLGTYGADSTKVSVSGVSSGANMAVQLHVAYSASIMGVGSVAGAPYYCAEGSYTAATSGRCGLGNANDINVQDLIDQTESYAISSKVDPTSNMASDRVYIFSGTEDIIVPTDVVKKLEDYYDNYVNAGNKKTKYDLAAGHAFITTNYGNTCGDNFLLSHINDCNYNMAYDILNHIYGNLVEPGGSTTLSGQIITFDQTDFFPSSWNVWPYYYKALTITGRIYVPSGCSSTTSGCKLHVALHGCSQSTYNIGNLYYKNTGYNEVGELNDIIILYPQVYPQIYNAFIPSYNPLACWDWWGHTNGDYATNEGPQMKAIKDMIDQILS